MSPVRLDNLSSVRKALGVSQSRAAKLLGVSTKAIQSYEQGSRSVPAYIQRIAALLLYTRWRKIHGTAAPCWKTTRCPAQVRNQCPAFLQQAGDLCWLVTGTFCHTANTSSPAKLAGCEKCAVMKKWLNR